MTQRFSEIVAAILALVATIIDGDWHARVMPARWSEVIYKRAIFQSKIPDIINCAFDLAEQEIADALQVAIAPAR